MLSVDIAVQGAWIDFDLFSQKLHNDKYWVLYQELHEMRHSGVQKLGGTYIIWETKFLHGAPLTLSPPSEVPHNNGSSHISLSLTSTEYPVNPCVPFFIFSMISNNQAKAGWYTWIYSDSGHTGEGEGGLKMQILAGRPIFFMEGP